MLLGTGLELWCAIGIGLTRPNKQLSILTHGHVRRIIDIARHSGGAELHNLLLLFPRCDPILIALNCESGLRMVS